MPWALALHFELFVLHDIFKGSVIAPIAQNIWCPWETQMVAVVWHPLQHCPYEILHCISIYRPLWIWVYEIHICIPCRAPTCDIITVGPRTVRFCTVLMCDLVLCTQAHTFCTALPFIWGWWGYHCTLSTYPLTVRFHVTYSSSYKVSIEMPGLLRVELCPILGRTEFRIHLVAKVIFFNICQFVIYVK